MVTLLIIAAGASGVIAGVQAYRGRWTRWAQRSGYLHCLGFALLFLGSGTTILGIAGALPGELQLVVKLAIVWGVLIIGGIFSIVWMPAVALPRWFREGREQRREIERAAHEAERARRALRKGETHHD